MKSSHRKGPEACARFGHTIRGWGNVAIKTSQRFSDRFSREVARQPAESSEHLPLYDLGTLTEGGSYLMMEFVDGSPIAPVDSTRKPLDLTVQIADGSRCRHPSAMMSAAYRASTCMTHWNCDQLRSLLASPVIRYHQEGISLWDHSI
jgi:hypothetical protein